MDRRTLIVLAVAVVVMMGIVAGVGLASSGLSYAQETQAKTAIADLATAKTTLQQRRQKVEAALESDPELFTAQADVWPLEIETAAKQLDEAQLRVPKIEELLALDDREKWGEIEQNLQELRSAIGVADSLVSVMESAVDERLEFKRNRAAMIAALEATANKAAASSFEPLEIRARQAGTDWPGKREDLARRTANLKAAKNGVAQAWATVQDQDRKFEKKAADFDIDVLMLAASNVRQLGDSIAPAMSSLGAAIDQLYVSWDRMLTDLEIREGAEVTFHAKFKTVTTTITDFAEKQNKVEESEVWETITESQYKQYENNVGMVVAHKSAGKFDSETETKIQPPGYAYIASPDQGSNQYGRWERRGSGSFWVWYGQYSLMRDVFWGRGYYSSRPIVVNDYRGYERSRRTNQPYYGNDGGKKRYGSAGSFTKSRYASTKYVKSGGFKNSRYKTSGGKFRGTKYVSRRSSSGTTRRSTSFGRSSRSWGRSSFRGGK